MTETFKYLKRSFKIAHFPFILLLTVLIPAPLNAKQYSAHSLAAPFPDELGHQVIDSIRTETISKADQLMKEKPVTVTASSCKRSAGGKNDFYSEGDYWWPDPANPKGPYIQKDGQTNPENFVDHRLAMIRLSEITATLTSAWILTANRKYAEQASKHLHAWFVNPVTRMNPDMLYAQAIWGRFTGRGIGLIDAYHLVEVAQSAKILIESEAIPQNEALEIKEWFSNFLTWMTTHQYGIDEMNAKNNHGTCWAVTAAAMADLTGNEEVKKLCADRFKTIFLPLQMAGDGSFPLELKRTKPYGYSLFNIDAMCNLAQILSTAEDNLWEFKTPDGKSLKKGMEYIYPYIKDQSKWPFAKDIYIWDEWPVRQSSLLFSGLAYQNPDYIHTFLSLPAYPTHQEVIRNLPVRHPVIWIKESNSWQASQETIDKLSKSQTGFNYVENKVPAYILPDLLTSLKEKKITNKKDWEKLRRPELLELFTTQVYGRTPTTSYQKTMKVVKEDPRAMNGAATFKLVDITITANEKTLTFQMGLFIPNDVPKPVPAFLLVCNRPPGENIDFTREKKSEFWPAEEVIARGYAVAAFYNGDLDPDQHDNFQNGIHGLLDTKRTAESWGTLAAWAWGASRCMDYLVSDKDIAHEKVAFVGHSRGGKTTLWAGALDERFAMIVSNEAGCGGSSLARRRYGETIERINKAFPHWFCQNYKNFSNREDSLPVDQHMLMALIAPRALYIASASDDLWADPRGQYLALYNALPAYQLFSPSTKLPKSMPALNQPVSSGKVAYHVRDGSHNLTLKDWNFFMDHADKVLK